MSQPHALRSVDGDSYKEVHDIIFPADIREADLVRAEVSIPSIDIKDQSVRVWRLSPLGLEFLFEDQLGISQGQEILVTLYVNRRVSRFDGVVVECSDTRKTKHLAVVRIYGRRRNESPNEERRSSTRWMCSSQFYPVAVSPNPLIFNDFLYFTIKDISATGLKALTSLRNKYLVPGMELDLQVSFPMTGYAQLSARIVRTALTSDAGKDYLELGMELGELQKAERETLGQYLVQFSSADSYEDIRRSGLRPISLARGVDYSFIRTPEDFSAVLDLRFAANKAVGKIPDGYSAPNMADAFDSRCRILAAKYKGKIVGTIRMGFVEQEESLEVESYVSLPQNFPRKDEIIECSRAATHPNFRRADLWYSLIQHAAVSALQAKRRYGVICTTDELVGMYQRLGFQQTGIRFEMPLYPGKTQNLLLIDILGVVMGNGVGPIAWGVVWKQVADFVQNQQFNEFRQAKSTRARVYRMIAPISRFIVAAFGKKLS